jgi:putative membrane protein
VVAFVAGFYEEFIYSLRKINAKALKLLINGRFKSFYNYINGRFLSLLFFGMIVSYFSISKVLDYLIKYYELYVWSVFFGMIIGSIYYINKDFKDWNYKTYLSLFIGIILGVGVSFLNPAKENDNLWFVFFCGIISVSGMALPGFSGSFILMLLGNYVLLLVESVNSLYDTVSDIIIGDFSFISNFERIRMLKVLVVFTLGSLTGLITFSNLLSYILKHYKSITISAIIGFIIGSLGVVWPWKKTIFKLNETGNFIFDSRGEKVVENYKRYIPELTNETYYAIAFIFIGIAIVLALEIYGQKTRKEYA